MSEFNPRIGEITPLMDGLHRIIAPNPSPMTFRGTNTYILGTDHIAVIDPGPHDMQHLRRILAAAGDARIHAIFVTHAHKDHSPLARLLSKLTDAPVMAFGDALAGRSPEMVALAEQDVIGGGEGVDMEFAPHVTLEDGETTQTTDWTITAHHTPGHMANHMCFQWNDVMFTGDIVMGWASSLVSPPDGDMTQFMDSLDRMSRIDCTTYFPGHGAPVDAPLARVTELRDHRIARETAILDALSAGPKSVIDLTRAIYADTPEPLWPAAGRNILAHLIALSQSQQITSTNGFAPNAIYRVSP